MSEAFFDSLNYTLSNEDTSLELAVLPEDTGHVFAVAGSGSRIIPLLSKNPRHVTCIDSSAEQLSCAELRIASMKALEHEDFLAFWGYPSGPMSSGKRRAIFEKLEISDLSKERISFFFEKRRWGPLLYAGKWERTFQKLSRVNRWIVGSRGLGIFSCRTKEEQKNYMETAFPKNAWSFSVFLLGNAFVFNALLYKGNFPQKNIPQSMRAFYLERFNRLFEQDIARKNYLLQLLFLGKLKFVEGLPVECDPEIFLRAKMALQKTRIAYIHGDIIEEAKRTKVPIDFLSFSDVPSYLKPPQEQEFLQETKSSISSGGIVVNRYYLRIPGDLDAGGYREITDSFKEAIAKEKMQMYSFGIYQKV